MPPSKWIIEALPVADRQFVDAFLRDHDFHFYAELKAKLAERGVTVTVGALQRYAGRMKRARELRGFR